MVKRSHRPVDAAVETAASAPTMNFDRNMRD
jgi:hypothetical protein